MKTLISTLISAALIYSPLAAANSFQFTQTIHGAFPFAEVELVSRVHAIGLYRGGGVVLSPWIEVSERAYLGIDQEGRVLQVVQLADRNVAFLLSGEAPMIDLFYQPPALLIAVGRDGQLYQFQWPVWQHGETKSIIKNAVLRAGLSLCSVTMGLAAYCAISGTPFVSPEILASVALAGIGSIGMQSLFASAHFEKQNEITNGFQKLNTKIAGFRRSELIWGADGFIGDYELKGDQGKYSLAQAIAPELLPSEGAQNFDWSCEHELLPRGVPAKSYDPFDTSAK